MARPFVIECKAALARADLYETALERNEPLRVRCARTMPRRLDPIGRLQRRLGEEVQNIHQDQFLMLLLVGEAQIEAVAKRSRQDRA